MSKLDKRKLSVIIAAYNAEKYIEQSIDCIVAMPMWKEHKIQLVIVNDGSNDNTGLLCEKYRDFYPDDFFYIRNDANFGVSAARNAGLKEALGEYVTFLDADDYWDAGSLESLCNYLDDHIGEIDCVFGRIRYFEGQSSFVTPNALRQSAMIVDVDQSPTFVQTNINNAVIKRKTAEKWSIDHNLGRCNELFFLSRIIMQKRRYGIEPSAKYNYRIRRDYGNLSLHFHETNAYYTSSFEPSIISFMNSQRKTDGSIPIYVQNVVLYELDNRLSDNETIQQHLNQEEHQAYKKAFWRILSEIEGETISSSNRLPIEKKLYLLRLKDGDSFMSAICFRNGRVYYKKSVLYDFRKNKAIVLGRSEFADGELVLEGRSCVPVLENDQYSLFLSDSQGNEYPLENYEQYDRSLRCLGEEALLFKGFKVKIPIHNDLVINGIIKIGNDSFQISFKFKKHSKLSEQHRRSYYRRENVTLYTKGKALVLDTERSRFYFESRYCKELIKRKEWDEIKLRQKVLRARRKKKTSVWLFVDRIDSADENAEFLFEYVNRHKPQNVDLYYVIDEKSTDYARLHSIGNVIPFGSKKFYKLYFTADEYITSQTTGFITFPTSLKKYKCIRDLMPDNVLYLQHGVLEKDMSYGQNLLRQNFRMFVTSSFAEYNSMLEYPYGYTQREVKLTGLARHDQLIPYMGKRGKTITIAPTWRSNLATRIDPKHGGRGYYPKFKESEFFYFYNNLINDERIIKTMKNGGYRGVFRPHPYMRVQMVDFDLGEMFSVADEQMSFVQQFDDCGLLITDYSSTATDYAYIGCPVIYSQFDIDTFYDNHTYNAGFFDYERDGFGPVCYDYESTVKEIVKMLESGCLMEKQYDERRKQFFAFFDGKNCERILNEIMEIDKERIL